MPALERGRRAQGAPRTRRSISTPPSTSPTAPPSSNADVDIQLHGGIGVTDEHDAHLLLKHACCSRACSARSERCWRGCSTPSSRSERGWISATPKQTTSSGRERAHGCRPTSRGRRGRRDGRAAADFDRDWQRKLYEHGWAGVAWPKEYGGLGLSAPPAGHLVRGAGAGPRAAPHQHDLRRDDARGPDADRARHGGAEGLPPAADPVRARRSGARASPSRTPAPTSPRSRPAASSTATTSSSPASRCGRPTRSTPTSRSCWSGPTRPRSGTQGLTWLICDMRSPGIDIKPIRTMLLDEHVNMVFYDEVRIPRANVVGEIGDGWSTALATLSFERGIGLHRRPARALRARPARDRAGEAGAPRGRQAGDRRRRHRPAPRLAQGRHHGHPRDDAWPTSPRPTAPACRAPRRR